jgi:hypothetical protein
MDAMKRTWVGLIIITLSILLASCGKGQLSEAEIQEKALNIAAAYFAYDYSQADQWMSAVKDSNYYTQYIQTDVMPILGPYMSEHQVKSVATLLSSSVYYQKDLGNDSQMIVWKLEFNVEPNWPSDGPPPPFNSGDINGIPWTGEKSTIVYAVATYIDNDWSIFLIPSNPIDDPVPSLQTQD